MRNHQSLCYAVCQCWLVRNHQSLCYAVCRHWLTRTAPLCIVCRWQARRRSPTCTRIVRASWEKCRAQVPASFLSALSSRGMVSLAVVCYGPVVTPFCWGQRYRGFRSAHVVSSPLPTFFIIRGWLQGLALETEMRCTTFSGCQSFWQEEAHRRKCYGKIIWRFPKCSKLISRLANMSLLQPILHWGSKMNFLRERFLLETVKDTLFKQQQQQQGWPASTMHICGELIIFWDPWTSYPPNNNNNSSPSHPFPWKADGWGVLGCEKDIFWQESRAVRKVCRVGVMSPLEAGGVTG